MLEVKTVTSTAVWYHISSAKGDSASRWAKGAARKGVYNGQSSLSLILFDREELRQTIGSDYLQEAVLEIRRDSAYGTDAVTVCMAPANILNMDESYMSRSQCVNLAKRKLHKCHVVEGDTAIFRLPGTTLRQMYLGEVNAFLLYQEKDGSDSYCRFADSAVLKLTVGSGLATPVWTRTISAGDPISNEIYSHLADLRELEYYIVLRNKYYNPGPIIWARTLQDYGAWTEYINLLRSQANQFLEQEGRTYEWTPLPAGKTRWDVPQADVINNLRGVLRGAQSGRYEAQGFTAMQSKSIASANFDQNAQMTWEQAETLIAGKKSKYVIPQGGGPSVLYFKYVCGWIFDWESTNVTDAAVELTVKASDKAAPHVALYAVTAESIPASAAYSAVFEAEGTVIGEANCAVGKTVTIPINQSGIMLLNNGAHGVGIRYDNDYVELLSGAALIINQGGE